MLCFKERSMELYEEILADLLEHKGMRIAICITKTDISKVVEGVCYQALQKIKTIIEDDSLEDVACFIRIEEIVSTLEEIGTNGGSRHDFG